jgi:hypothetical protein
VQFRSRRLKRVVSRTALPYVLAYTVRNNFCVFWETAALIRVHAEDPEVRRHIAVVPNDKESMRRVCVQRECRGRFNSASYRFQLN